jgi:hypothetical protein
MYNYKKDPLYIEAARQAAFILDSDNNKYGLSYLPLYKAVLAFVRVVESQNEIADLDRHPRLRRLHAKTIAVSRRELKKYGYTKVPYALCPECNKPVLPMTVVADYESATCDCPYCDCMLLIQGGVLVDFHKTLHNNDPRWPETGKGTYSI